MYCDDYWFLNGKKPLHWIHLLAGDAFDVQMTPPPPSHVSGRVGGLYLGHVRDEM